MTLDAHTHFELVKSNSNFVFYQININQSEFTYWKVEICKKNKRKWIYEIVTSVFDTHPPYTYVTISSSKEIMFWNRYPPTFWSNVTKYAVFFWRLPLALSLLGFTYLGIYNGRHCFPDTHTCGSTFTSVHCI